MDLLDYHQNLNIASGLGYDPHNDWTTSLVMTYADLYKISDGAS